MPRTVIRWAKHEGNLILIRDQFSIEGQLLGVYVGQMGDGALGHGRVLWQYVGEGFEFKPEHAFCGIRE